MFLRLKPRSGFSLRPSLFVVFIFLRAFARTLRPSDRPGGPLREIFRIAHRSGIAEVFAVICPPQMRGSRFIFFAGLAFFVAEAILSLLFYKERLILPDCANYLFDLVSNGGHLAIFHHRFIAGATQVLPYFAIKAHADLATVAMLYSLNLALFPLLCFLL